MGIIVCTSCIPITLREVKYRCQGCYQCEPLSNPCLRPSNRETSSG